MTQKFRFLLTMVQVISKDSDGHNKLYEERCRRPSVRPSVCLSSVVCLSVTFVHPTQTQTIDIFGNVSTPFGHL